MQHSIDPDSDKRERRRSTDRLRAPESAYIKNPFGQLFAPSHHISPKIHGRVPDWGSAVMDSIGGWFFIGCLRSLRIYLANHRHGQIFPSRISRKVGCSRALLGAG